MMKLYLVLLLQLYVTFGNETKPKLTFDEFFDYTTFSLLSFSPNGQYLLYGTRQPSWNTSSYEYSLWIYDIEQQTQKIITKTPHPSIKPQWSPNGKWIAVLLDQTQANSSDTFRYRRSFGKQLLVEQYIYLYSLETNDFLPIQLGKAPPLAFTWSDNDFSFFLATINLQLEEEKEEEESNEEWKDVIQYREDKKYEQSVIYRIDIDENHRTISTQRNIIKNVSFLLNELLYAPSVEKLICTSLSILIEDLQNFEIYSIDLQNKSSTVVQLTDNKAYEQNLQLSKDGQYLLFVLLSLSTDSKCNYTQTRVYSLNLINGEMMRFAEDFDGAVLSYAIASDDTVYILGQLGTQVDVYSQSSLFKELIHHHAWNGTYQSITISNQDSIAFIHTSTQKPMEVYLCDNIHHLHLAEPITNHNELFTQRDLPQTQTYTWKNKEDNQFVEGLLHYPPGQYQATNLPLLVLIHGGPSASNLDQFIPDWYSWAALAATEGWLVLEPNYRGSTGYGDQFLSDIRYRPLSLPGKDILYGVDQLIEDGIVDGYRLAVGGYSYGGFLTNWLITQTKRFNAALSGAGAVDHSSAWGTMDMPILFNHLFGGYPWETPHIYQNEAPIYQLDRVRTPTHIVAGEDDIRLPASQSYMLERGLYYRDIPVKLITFPGENHILSFNPWHGKIKVREELKWLHKYGNQSSF